MRENRLIISIFVCCCLFALCIFLLAHTMVVNFFSSSMQNIFFPLRFSVQKNVSPNTTAMQLAHLEQLAADNKALLDQFHTATPPPTRLVPVDVVGMGGAIPTVSFPEILIIHAGAKQGMRVGLVVVSGRQLVGMITALSDNYAQVTLITNKASSFSAKTITGAMGVLRGEGNGQLLFDNVLLSNNVGTKDTVVSLGSQNITGSGFPPNLIVGKVIHVKKNPSELFQSAEVMPLVSFDELSKVFVYFP